jgi:hypothetical protein
MAPGWMQVTAFAQVSAKSTGPWLTVVVPYCPLEHAPGVPQARMSAVNPLSTGRQVPAAQEGGDARTRNSVGVSEGRSDHDAYQGSARRLRCRATSTRVMHDAAGWLEFRGLA